MVEIPSQLKDPIWRIQNLYLIRDKNRRLVKMRFNLAQRRIIAVVGEAIRLGLKPIRHFDIKARQVGLSTFWGLIYLDNTIFTPNTISCIVAQKDESLKHIWDIIRVAHETMPDELRPRLKEDSVKTLAFADANSKIMVSLKVQSTVLHNLHVSEYPLCDPLEIEQTIAACPPNANISLEGVPEGMNHAYEKWVQTEDTHTHLFHPWFFSDEYRLPAVKPFLRTDEENTFAAKTVKNFDGYEVVDDQLQWRREKKKDLKRLYYQEFAEDESTCFLTSGGKFFEQAKMKALMEEAKLEPIIKKTADWTMWEDRQHRHIYVAGADIAAGRGGDYSALAIVCVTCRKTAFRYRARVSLTEFYGVCSEWGRHYSNALLAPEDNSFGLAVVERLIEDGYPNLYRQPGGLRAIGGPKAQLKFGWHTDKNSRLDMLVYLKECLEGEPEEDEAHFQPEIKWLDTELLNETLYVVDEEGKIEAKAGKHDDLVFAWGIAMQMYRGAARTGSFKSSSIILGDQLESAKEF